jgi:hypothetical protein
MERYVTSPLGRGVDRAQALISLGIGDIEEFVDQQQQIAEGIQLTAEDNEIMAKIGDEDTTALEAIELYVTNPRLVFALTFESMGLFAPVLAAGAAVTAATGGTGAPAVIAAAATIAAGSFGTEYYATIEGMLAEEGVDLQDTKQIEAKLADEDFMGRAREKAVKRGIPIAAFDALSVGLAGKILGVGRQASRAAKEAGKGMRGRRLAGAVGELGVQSGLGAAGEAGAQLASEGRITSAGEIVSEAVGEIVPGLGETALGSFARREPRPATPPPTGPPGTQGELAGFEPSPTGEGDIEGEIRAAEIEVGEIEPDVAEGALPNVSEDVLTFVGIGDAEIIENLEKTDGSLWTQDELDQLSNEDYDRLRIVAYQRMQNARREAEAGEQQQLPLRNLTGIERLPTEEEAAQQAEFDLQQQIMGRQAPPTQGPPGGAEGTGRLVSVTPPQAATGEEGQQGIAAQSVDEIIGAQLGVTPEADTRDPDRYLSRTARLQKEQREQPELFATTAPAAITTDQPEVKAEYAELARQRAEAEARRAETELSQEDLNAIVEEARQSVEIEPETAIAAWIDRQLETKAETASGRAPNVWRDPYTNTPKKARGILTSRIVQIIESATAKEIINPDDLPRWLREYGGFLQNEVEKGKKGKPETTWPKALRHFAQFGRSDKKIAELFGALVRAFDKADPMIAMALRRSVNAQNAGEPRHMADVLQGIHAALEGRKADLALLGTPYESRMSQYERSRIQADSWLAPGGRRSAKWSKVRELQDAVIHMLRGVTHLAAPRIQITTEEANNLSTQALAELFASGKELGLPMPDITVMEKGVKKILNGWDVLRDANKVLYAATDTSEKRARTLYSRLDDLAQALIATERDPVNKREQKLFDEYKKREKKRRKAGKTKKAKQRATEIRAAYLQRRQEAEIVDKIKELQRQALADLSRGIKPEPQLDAEVVEELSERVEGEEIALEEAPLTEEDEAAPDVEVQPEADQEADVVETGETRELIGEKTSISAAEIAASRVSIEDEMTAKAQADPKVLGKALRNILKNPAAVADAVFGPHKPGEMSERKRNFLGTLLNLNRADRLKLKKRLEQISGIEKARRERAARTPVSKNRQPMPAITRATQAGRQTTLEDLEATPPSKELRLEPEQTRRRGPGGKFAPAPKPLGSRVSESEQKRLARQRKEAQALEGREVPTQSFSPPEEGETALHREVTPIDIQVEMGTRTAARVTRYTQKGVVTPSLPAKLKSLQDFIAKVLVSKLPGKASAAYDFVTGPKMRLVAGFMNSLQQRGNVTGEEAAATGYKNEFQAFQQLINEFVAAPRSYRFKDLRNVAAGKELITGRTYLVNQQVTQPLDSEILENQLRSFVANRVADVKGDIGQGTFAFTNLKDIQDAVVAYANFVRTTQEYGFANGSIVYDSPETVEVYDKMIEEDSADFLDDRALEWANPDVTFTSGRSFLIDWRKSLPQGHWLRPLISKILETGIRINIHYDRDGTILKRSRGRYFARTETGRQFIVINPTHGIGGDGTVLRTVLHEMLHAVTVQNLADNPELMTRVTSIFDQAKEVALEQGVTEYGFRNVEEFIAEAFTNKRFQEFLDEIPMRQGFVGRFLSLLDALAGFIGISLNLGRKSTSVLETIMRQQDDLIAWYVDPVKSASNPLGAGTDGTISINKIYESGDSMVSRWNNWSRQNVGGISDALNKFQQTNLGFMNLDVIERKYRRVINDAVRSTRSVFSNPLTRVTEAIQRVTNRNTWLTREYAKLIEATQELTIQERNQLAQVLHDSTIAQYDPTDPKGYLGKSNQHLVDQRGKFKDERTQKRVQVSMDSWKNLGQEGRNLYKPWQKLLENVRNARVATLMKRAIEASINEEDLGNGVTGYSRESLLAFLDPANPEALAQNVTMEAFQKWVLDNNLQEEAGKGTNTYQMVGQILKMARMAGPYFPLTRDGDIAVIIPGETDPEFYSLHRTEKDAQAALAELKRQGYPDAELYYTDKRPPELGGTANAIEALMASLSPDVNKPGSDATRAQIRNELTVAANRLLADELLHASQLRRKNIAGANPLEMFRGIDDYVRSSLGAISSLDSVHDFQRGVSQLDQLGKALGNDPNGRLIQNIGYELKERQRALATDRDTSLTSKAFGNIGFFNYLGAPSYWLLNATQTAVVGVPVMAGLTGRTFAQSTKAMGRAYNMLRTMTSDMKRWEAFSDQGMDSIIAKVRTEMGPEAAANIERLIKEGIIQATLAHELGTVLESKNLQTYNKVTKFLTHIPEMIERFNRLSMAIATMDLGKMDYETVKDVVQASQFNYTPENRARLLKIAPAMLGGGARSFIQPMMMFKVFGFGMARLLYGNLIDGFGFNSRIQGPQFKEERDAARRTLYGILATHTLFGGLYGGLGIGLGSAILGVVNAMWDDDEKIDPDKWLDEFLTTHTNEYVARILTRGAPAAFGVDMSGSVNLNNLFYMSRDNDWSQYGQIEQSVYGLLGPVAQYFVGAGREFSKLMDGEATVGDFAEAAIPLKLYRGLSKAYSYGVEGLETGRGQTFMNSTEIGVGALTATALGFRSAKVAQRQDKFYAERSYNRVVEGTKGDLMGAFINADTPRERAEARKDILRWNARQRKKGNYSLIISSDGLRRSYESRLDTARDYANQIFTEYN